MLCHSADRSAVRVYCALRDRLGRDAVHLVSSEQLMIAPHWRHALERDRVASTVTLADGRRIDPDSLSLVFQRLQRVEIAQFAHAKPSDRDYAQSEMQALLLSWLEGLPCPVVNRASPRGLCGAERSLVEWLVLAARVGLPVRGYELVSDARRSTRRELAAHLAREGTGASEPPQLLRPELLGRGPVQWLERVEGTSYRLIVAGARCYGAPPDIDPAACVKLARLSGEHLLEIRLGRARGEWRVCSATPVPELSSEAARFVAETCAEMRMAA
ncbi:hypothetical protein YTPLAS18_31950 [Nitrospira sp.]|nr:hypothetical protein YTPLAS18_31950 [Nitrospira sp.]